MSCITSVIGNPIVSIPRFDIALSRTDRDGDPIDELSLSLSLSPPLSSPFFSPFSSVKNIRKDLCDIYRGIPAMFVSSRYYSDDRAFLSLSPSPFPSFFLFPPLEALVSLHFAISPPRVAYMRGGGREPLRNRRDIGGPATTRDPRDTHRACLARPR